MIHLDSLDYRFNIIKELTFLLVFQACIAPMVEQFHGKEEVIGSTPIVSTTLFLGTKKRETHKSLPSKLLCRLIQTRYYSLDLYLLNI